MEYKILSSTSPEGLTERVNNLLKDGWKPIGGHSVVEEHRQNRFRGDQHVDTIVKTEYSQTMVREIVSKKIDVDVMFYYEDDNETIKVYDEEGMREEFETKLSNLINN